MYNSRNFSEVTDLLRTSSDFEKRIKELKEKDAKSHSREIAELLSKLRTNYRKLITDHFRSLLLEKRDVDSLLWKSCFYKQIEDFRRSIKKHSSQLDVLDSNQSFAVREKQQLYLAKLTSALLKFLLDSTEFYNNMMLELELRIQQIKEEMSPDSFIANEAGRVVDFLMKCVCRCLLYLGDLARYREIYSDRNKKDFAEAERCYERAALISPSSGNAQNQLAVLATYNQIEYVAVYHYCRSVLVRQPFTGGLENLSLLFAKNARSFQALRTTTPAQFRAKQLSREGKSASDAGRLKTFFVGFIRLHGLLFEWASRLHRDAASVPSSMESALTGANSIDNQTGTESSVDPDEFLSLLQNTLDDLDHLLLVSAQTPSGTPVPLGESVLVQLLCVCLFSVHFGAMREENLVMEAIVYADPTELYDLNELSAATANSIPSVAQKTGGLLQHRRRSLPESLALIALFGFANKAASRAAAILSGGSDKSERRVAYASKLYPAISVFCDWAALHPRYLQATVECTSGLGDASTAFACGAHWYDADKNLLMSEGRARSGMRAALSSLCSVLEPDMRRYEAGRGGSRNENVKLLREHIALRGYLPLNDRYEPLFAGFDPLAKTVSVVSDSAARYRRQSTISSFVLEVLEPLAAQEAIDADLRRQAQSSVHPISVAAKAKVGKLFDPGAMSSTPGNKRVSQRDQKASARKARTAQLVLVSEQPDAVVAEMDLGDFPALSSDGPSVGSLCVVGDYRVAIERGICDPLPFLAENIAPAAAEVPSAVTVAKEQETELDFEEEVVFRPAFSRLTAAGCATLASPTPDPVSRPLGDSMISLFGEDVDESGYGLSHNNSFRDRLSGLGGGMSCADISDFFAPRSPDLLPHSSSRGSKLSEYSRAVTPALDAAAWTGQNTVINHTNPASWVDGLCGFSLPAVSAEGLGSAAKLSSLFAADSFAEYWDRIPTVAGVADRLREQASSLQQQPHVDTFSSLLDDSPLPAEPSSSSSALLAPPPGIQSIVAPSRNSLMTGPPPGLTPRPPPALVSAPQRNVQGPPPRTANPFVTR